jgi:hypothetical protein
VGRLSPRDRRALSTLEPTIHVLATTPGATRGALFGQRARSRWEILWRGSTVNRFLSSVRDVAVQVVPLDA